MKRLVALLLLTFLMTGANSPAALAEEADSPLLTAPQLPAAGWNKSDSDSQSTDSTEGASSPTSVSKDSSVESNQSAPSKELAQAASGGGNSKKDADAASDADKKKKKKAKKSKEKTDAADAAKDSKASSSSDSKDPAASKDKSSTSSDTDSKSDKKSDGPGNTGFKKAKSTVPLPTRVASFTCGAVLGYPIAMAKRTVRQTKLGARDFIGESRNPIKLGTALAVSIPYGVVGGFLEGWQYTVMNSWRASGEEPFGKETFSLDDDTSGSGSSSNPSGN